MPRLRSPWSIPLASRIILLFAAGLVLLQALDYFNFTVDDVFIPIRYATNAARGEGLVYNKGEFVEGYSDPIWVFGLTAVAAATAGSSHQLTLLLGTAKAVSFLFGILTLVLLYRFTLRLFEESPHARLYAALAVLSGAMCAPFIAWSIGGLETTLQALLYLALATIVYAVLKERSFGKPVAAKHYLSLLAISLLLLLVHPEPIMLCIITFVYLYILLSKPERWRFLRFSVIPFLLGTAIFLVWRWVTYGNLVPNTFFAKTGGLSVSPYVNGVKYVLSSFGLLIAPLLLIIPFAYTGSRKRDPFIVFLTIAILFQCAFAIGAKGDWMPGARFLISIEPLLVLLGMFGLVTLLESIPHFTVPGFPARAMALIAIVIATTFAMAGRTAFRGESRGLISGFARLKGYSLLGHEQVALWLRPRVNDHTTVALTEAGLISAMLPDTRILDLNGLMNAGIAHERQRGEAVNVESFLSQHPEYVVFHNDVASPILTTLATDPRKALEQDSLFHQAYQLIQKLPNFDIYARISK